MCADIIQLKENIWKPIAYANCSLTPTEERYAVIEKEALSITWTCERLAQYMVGKHFEIMTGDSPLVSLFFHKRLDELLLRIQQFRICMMRFTYSISHVPGREKVLLML